MILQKMTKSETIRSRRIRSKLVSLMVHVQERDVDYLGNSHVDLINVCQGRISDLEQPLQLGHLGRDFQEAQKNR